MSASRDDLDRALYVAYAEIDTLRAQLAERDALLQRALPFLSNTPDLVQHGAEDLAQEIRSASAGKPCYGPNEWGTECGQCSKCESASAEPSAPIKHDEQVKFKTHFADYLSGANKLGTDYNNLVARGMEIGWMACAGVPGKPSQP